MLRTDAAQARYMAWQANTSDVKQYMPWPVEEEPEATSIQDIASLLRATTKGEK